MSLKRISFHPVQRRAGARASTDPTRRFSPMLPWIRSSAAFCIAPSNANGQRTRSYPRRRIELQSSSVDRAWRRVFLTPDSRCCAAICRFVRIARTVRPVRMMAKRDRTGLNNAVEALKNIAGGPVFLGGHSYGGRQASMLCAECPKDEPDQIPGLLLLSYPLHPPRKPDTVAHTALLHLAHARTFRTRHARSFRLHRRSRTGHQADSSQDKVVDRGGRWTRSGIQRESEKGRVTRSVVLAQASSEFSLGSACLADAKLASVHPPGFRSAISFARIHHPAECNFRVRRTPRCDRACSCRLQISSPPCRRFHR